MFLYSLQPQYFFFSPIWMKMPKFSLQLTHVIQIFFLIQFVFSFYYLYERLKKDNMLFCHNHEKEREFKDFYLHSKPQLKLSLKRYK